MDNQLSTLDYLDPAGPDPEASVSVPQKSLGETICERKSPIICGILSIFFLMITVVGYAVPVVAYERTKAANQGAEFLSVDQSLVGLHWACFLPASISFFSFALNIFNGFDQPSSNRATRSMILVGMWSGSWAATVWIIYIVFSLMVPEYQLLKTMISYEQYRALALTATNSLPVFAISIKGNSDSVKCTFFPPEIPASFATDSTSLSQIGPGQDGFFSAPPRLSVTWDPASEAAIQESIRDIEKALVDYKTYGDLEWTVTRENRLQNLTLPEFAFVSESGKLPTPLSTGTRVAEALFFCGLVYAYRLVSIPQWQDNIVKLDAAIGTRLPHNLSDIGLPYCSRNGYEE
jgi:hypothetical protein